MKPRRGWNGFRFLAGGAVLLLVLAVLAPVRCRAQNPARIQALIQVLQDPRASVTAKGDACRQLMGLGPRAQAAVPALTELLKNQDELLRDCAITTLNRIGPAARAALPVLRRVALMDPVAGIRQLAAEAMQRIDAGAPGAVPAARTASQAAPAR